MLTLVISEKPIRIGVHSCSFAVSELELPLAQHFTDALLHRVDLSIGINHVDERLVGEAEEDLPALGE